MNIHKNARTTPHSRARIAGRVAAGERPAGIARDVGVSERTVKKWAARAAEGELALEDRSCRPHHSPRAISTGLMVEIQRLRRTWRWTGAQIAESVGVSRATAARTLRQLGMARLGPVGAVVPGRRYEWAQPGQLVHLDIKKLGRFSDVGHRITGDRRRRTPGIGWAFVHVCIDDCSRVAYVEVLHDERSVTVVGFLRRALIWFRRRGVLIERILTDNGSAYRSRFLAAVCRARRLGQRFTRPYTPRTNGKAERFIQTLLREWAYRVPYATSAHRAAALPRWLHYYNWHRRHSALRGQPPISRVVSPDNLLSLHS